MTILRRLPLLLLLGISTGCSCLCGESEPPKPCPLTAGAYTLEQTTSPHLKLSVLNPFDLGAPGKMTLDVADASQPECVHPVVVPSPGGLSLPIACIPALSFTVGVAQSGCGAGRLDSNGGADYTVVENGDTSDASPQCSLPHSGCAYGSDGSMRVDVQVGDGAADACATGTANLLVSIPVSTTFWLDDTFQCPDPDGVYDPGSDTLVLSFRQMLDLTSDASKADWKDLDGDGCCVAGTGPASPSACAAGGGPLSEKGACLDVAGIGTAGADVTLVASGPVASDGAPLYDVTTSWSFASEVSGPAAPLGAVCSTPAAIDFGGAVTRCMP